MNNSLYKVLIIYDSEQDNELFIDFSNHIAEYEYCTDFVDVASPDYDASQGNDCYKNMDALNTEIQAKGLQQYSKIIYFSSAVIEGQDYNAGGFLISAKNSDEIPEVLKTPENRAKTHFIIGFNDLLQENKNWEKYYNSNNDKAKAFSYCQNGEDDNITFNFNYIKDIFPSIEKTAQPQPQPNLARVVSGVVAASSGIAAITTACLNKIQKGIEKGSIPKIETLKKLVDYIQEQQGKSILLDKRTIGLVCAFIAIVCADYSIRDSDSMIVKLKNAITSNNKGNSIK